MMEQIFPLLGVRLIAINDNYDSNNYKGTTLGMDVVVSNLVNTMYCRDAGKKLRTANQVKWRKGITTASAAPFGYQFDPDKKGAFIIDPPAAKIVRRIFDLAILGLGTRDIAMMLNDESVPVPSVYNKENKAYGNARLGERIRKSSRPGGHFIPQECESYRLSVSIHADRSALLE